MVEVEYPGSVTVELVLSTGMEDSPPYGGGAQPGRAVAAPIVARKEILDSILKEAPDEALVKIRSQCRSERSLAGQNKRARKRS